EAEEVARRALGGADERPPLRDGDEPDERGRHPPGHADEPRGRAHRRGDADEPERELHPVATEEAFDHAGWGSSRCSPVVITRSRRRRSNLQRSSRPGEIASSLTALAPRNDTIRGVELQSVLLDPAVERLPRQPERLGGAGDVAAVL